MTYEAIDQIFALKEMGLEAFEIAEKIGIAESTVRYVLNEWRKV